MNAHTIATAATEKPLCLGVVTAAHGIRGAVRVRSYTADPAAIGDYGPLSDESGTRSFALKVTGLVKGSVIAEIAGVADRNAAEALRGLHLHVARTQLPEAEEDEFYHADLIGLRAELEDGKELGLIVAVHDFGAGVSIEIARSGDVSKGGAELVVPFTRAAVPQIDLSAGRVVVAEIAGLFDKPEPPASLAEQEAEAEGRAAE